MLAETKSMISAYESEGILKVFARDIHSAQMYEKETLTAEKRVMLAIEERDDRIKIDSLGELFTLPHLFLPDSGRNPGIQ
jgi:hypothetical protein